MVPNQIRGNHNITRIYMVLEIFFPHLATRPLLLTSLFKQEEVCEANNKYPLLFDVTFIANVYKHEIKPCVI
jgi:aspartyl/asparaginyl beta-hydroxylase (cupin superfamily)